VPDFTQKQSSFFQELWSGPQCLYDFISQYIGVLSQENEDA